MSPASPQLKPLSMQNRRWVFVSMFGMFLVLVPLLVLYATGYRFNLFNIEGTFRVVGGLYITTDVGDAKIMLNEEPVEDVRIFQRAAYIQNVPDGIHDIYVEAPGSVTWVKKLPVFAHLVTEARSFNLPAVPQVHVITPWLHATSSASVLFAPTSTTPFANASTSNVFFIATSTATSTYVVNSEYTYVMSLFGTTTEPEITRATEALNAFSFDRTTASVSTTSTATTTKILHNSRLYEVDGEVYVTWLGDIRSTPYYYCVNYQGASSTAALYGTHVYKQLEAQLASTTDLKSKTHYDEILCRDTIRIDRGYSEVTWFDFMPDNRDLVMMLLNDGLYVVEADDRAWQNIEKLYPGKNLKVVIDGRSIYVQDGDYLLELSTTLQQ